MIKDFLFGFVFLGVFLSVITFMHYYPLSEIFRNYNIPKKYFLLAGLTYIVLFLLVTFINNISPNVVTDLLKKGFNLWLGIIFIFFFVTIFFKLLDLILKFKHSNLVISIIIISTIIIAYSIFNANQLSVKEVNINTDKIDRDYKMVQISDVHIGSNSGKLLTKIVTEVNKIDPEIVFITGDLIDEGSIKTKDLSSLLDLNAKKVYFIYGNHEHYVKKEYIDSLISDIDNLIILRNETTKYENLSITGFDDGKDAKKMLNNTNITLKDYNVLLYHYPSSTELVKEKGFDLMLSGHTHKGQIFPFGYLVRLQFKYTGGFYDLGSLKLNVNTGTGTWGPKMRLGSKSEITLINLKKE